MHVPAFDRLARAHIPLDVPYEWRWLQHCTLQDVKDDVKQAVAAVKEPGSNMSRRPSSQSFLNLCKDSWCMSIGPFSVAWKSRNHGMKPSYG